MKGLNESKKLVFKQIEFNETLVQHMINKIMYHNNRLTYFINIEDLSYLDPYKHTITNTNSNDLTLSYISNDNRFFIIEKQIIIKKGATSNRYSGNETCIFIKTENNQTLIRVLAYAWRYKKLYEAGTPIKAIMQQEKVAHRTIYKYLNLAYLSPTIINHIMDGNEDICIDLQRLFKIASSYGRFDEQEKEYFWG